MVREDSVIWYSDDQFSAYPLEILVLLLLKFDSFFFFDFWTNGRHWRTLPPFCVVLTNMVVSRQLCRKGEQSETSFVEEWAAMLLLSLSTGGWLSQCADCVPNSLFGERIPLWWWGDDDDDDWNNIEESELSKKLTIFDWTPPTTWMLLLLK